MVLTMKKTDMTTPASTKLIQTDAYKGNVGVKQNFQRRNSESFFLLLLIDLFLFLSSRGFLLKFFFTS